MNISAMLSRALFFSLIACSQLALPSGAAAQTSATSSDVAAWASRGIDAWESGDFDRAREPLTRAAEAGHADAQTYLARMYRDGAGVPRNLSRAVEFFQRAVEQGQPSAQVSLASLYRDGRGVEQDEARAVELFRASAEQGYASGLNNLGIMYRSGRGVERDDAEASRLYRLAGEAGSGLGYSNLGVLYEAGEGVPQDLNRAAEYYRLAMPLGASTTTMYRLARLLDSGRDGVTLDRAEAMRLFERASSAGHVESMYRLLVAHITAGRLNARGRSERGYEGFEPDGDRFLALLHDLIEARHAEAMVRGADAYRGGVIGLGVEQDADRRMDLLVRAARLEHTGAARQLVTTADILLRNYEYAEAAALLHVVAEGPDNIVTAEGAQKLGTLYQLGRGVTESEEAARRYLRRSAELGYPQGMFDYAWALEFPAALGQDCDEAERWYVRADDEGNQRAWRRMNLSTGGANREDACSFP